MIFKSEAIRIERLDNNIAQLHFDREQMPVNKFDELTVAQLSAALDALEAETGISGLLISSDKSEFIVGADIGEFVPMFSASKDDIIGTLSHNNMNFSRLSQLPYPTCVAINGFALGGGLELCLACDLRVMSSTAKIGLPETKLGLMPGWGGSARLPRLIGVEQAITWMATGAEQKAIPALSAGAVDAVAEPDILFDTALDTLQEAINDNSEYTERRQQHAAAIGMSTGQASEVFAAIRAQVKKQAGNNYPAPLNVVDLIAQSWAVGVNEAITLETKAFSELIHTQSAAALVGMFLSDQLLSRKARKWAKASATPLTQAAVLGAGIMGGGIAYQSAFRGVPIKMKDIAQQGLDLGLKEANALLAKRVKRGSMSEQTKADVLSRIDASLSYDNFDQVDIVVEAVVENANVKKAVLAEAETYLRDDAVLVSNTSTISITGLATALKRPANFCGMHFFNPVHAMPLVEVIRGEKTSDATVAATVAYALKLGKKPVVVNDCPGFLVNRVLFPYFDGFSQLLHDGADYEQLDKVMEQWGWPMGPAYLLDVVGIDTGVHAGSVMAEGFPDRMKLSFKSATEVLFENKRFGQKNNLGYYDYVADERGRLQKTPSTTARELIAAVVGPATQFNDEDIVFRIMLPMATEMARCLEEGIVGTAAEADLALMYGLGFPAFRGGVFRWVDAIGLKAVAAASEKFAHLGKAYQLTDGMKAMLADGKTYY